MLRKDRQHWHPLKHNINPIKILSLYFNTFGKVSLKK